MNMSRRAFSLVELLLAVFILGIGIIGISALFPAGIAQQRQANDDIMGPIVADNAMAILRTKLNPEWFGTTEEFGQGDQLFPNASLNVIHHSTVPGDWEWKRPGFLFKKISTDPLIDERGAIDIFSAYYTSNQLEPGVGIGIGLDLTKVATENFSGAGGGAPLYGIPYSPTLGIPAVIIFQNERTYPAGVPGTLKTKRPSYFWECMFRRFAGRIQVAIFVYRVVDGGGEPRDYRAAQGSNALGSTIPPLPLLADISTTPFAPWKFGGLDGVATTMLDNATVRTPVPAATPGNISVEQSWQFPGQWILDEYNTVHRVLSGRRTTKDGAVILTRSIPAHPPIPELFGATVTGGTTTGGVANDPGVSFIWFIPTVDSRGFSLVPVFATVQDL